MMGWQEAGLKNMDVIKKLTVLVFPLWLAACAPKTANTVFPENTSQSSKCQYNRIAGHYLVMWENGSVTAHEDADTDHFVEHFVKPNLDQIHYVEYDKTIKLATVNSESVVGGAPDWGQTMTEADGVWSQGITGQNILVGVTDQGMDYNHPQLTPRLAINAIESAGQPGKDDDGNGLIDDVYGWDFSSGGPTPTLGTLEVSAHGTHVAGIIAADHTKGPVKGMAPDAHVIPAAFLDSTGSGATSAAISALNYAASRGAKIINASWGGDRCSLALQSTMQAINDQGILLVVAAGNEGHDLDVFPDYPAVLNLSNQITVGALRSDGYLDSYSNHSYHFVQLAAPGTHIYSTYPRNNFGYMDGTSMAAPFVSGAAALLWSARPAATAAQIRQALLTGVDSGPYRVETQGRLNVRKALEALKQMIGN